MWESAYKDRPFHLLSPYASLDVLDGACYWYAFNPFPYYGDITSCYGEETVLKHDTLDKHHFIKRHYIYGISGITAGY